MIAGGLTVIIWDYIPFFGKIVSGGEEAAGTLGNVTGLYSLVVGFAVGAAVIVIVSLLTKAPSEEMLREFEEVKNNKKLEITAE